MEKKKDYTINQKMASKKDLGSKVSKPVINETNKRTDMSRKRKSILPWLLLLLVGLMGLNGYQWMVKNKLDKTIQVKDKEFEEIRVITAQLDKDYETAIESLEEMRSDNIELNELISTQKEELTNQKKKIKQLIWTKRELKKAKTEIQGLEGLKNGYIAEVNQLKAKIESLNQDNNTLRNKNSELVTFLDNEKTEKASIIKEKEALDEVNKGLNSQVDMANAIKINFMEVTGYKDSSGKLKKKRRAKNIDILRTCFTTETNMVTPEGSKNFKIRIVDPMGTTIYNEQLGSGAIVEKLSGKKVQYTTSGDVQYENEDKNACIDYRPSSPLVKGTYDLEMFNNEYLVGKGSFELK